MLIATRQASRVIKGEREWFLCVWGEKREGWKDGRMEGWWWLEDRMDRTTRRER